MSFWDDSSEPVVLDRSGRSRRERAGLFVVVAVVAILALLLASGYAAAYSTAGDRVPRDTTISGVAVGGMTRSAAIARLRTAFARRSRQPIVLSAVDESGAERTVTIVPSQVGLRVVPAASVAQTGARRSWRPDRLWSYFSGPSTRRAVVRIDRAALGRRIASMSGGFGAAAINGRIVFSASGAHVVPGQSGEGVSLDDAVQAVESAYLAGDTQAHVGLVPAPPAIDASDVAEALADFARPAMSAPVVLRFGGRSLRLTPRQYAGALAMVPRDGRLVPRFFRPRLLALVRSAQAGTKPVDATFRIDGGVPRVVPARAGTRFSGDAVVSAFRRALTDIGTARTVRVAATKVQPAVTTADARGLGVVKQVAAFSAYFSSPKDDATIARSAQRLDGRLLRPGQVLAVEPTKGAGAVASATFSAAFFAGLYDLTPTLPIVVDPSDPATASGLRFRDDNRYAVLVHVTSTPARVGRPGSVRVALYSTPIWTITARKGLRTDLTRPPVRIEHGRSCHPSLGAVGYRVAVTRVFRRVGQSKVDHTEQMHSVRAPVARVVCR
ncbi:MAG: hypothetical protein FWE71_08400 [Nocardioidaceae bacterium]|nr:hypothetical protein [Nocardioidaceae bacterium]MCL2614896.1 hypothetical protein [Nocardioidaceae bacterium]